MSVCAAHDVYTLQTMTLFVCTHAGFYVAPLQIGTQIGTKWDLIGANFFFSCLTFTCVILLVVRHVAPASRCPSINLYKLDIFFNKPNKYLPNRVSQKSLCYVTEYVIVGAHKCFRECLGLSVVYSSPLRSIVWFHQ